MAGMGLRAWRRKRAGARAQQLYGRQLAAWEHEIGEARAALDTAQEFTGFSVDASPEPVPIVLEPDERVFLIIDGAGLIEARRGPGHYQGGSQGVSLHIAKGVSYRIGAQRGTFVPGEERPTVIDHGVAVVTDRRVVFEGSGQTREWAFAKLVGVQHLPGLTMIHVANRQRVSGVVYGEAGQDDVELRLDLAVAHFHGDVDRIVAGLKQHVQELEAGRPVPPVPPVPPG